MTRIERKRSKTDWKNKVMAAELAAMRIRLAQIERTLAASGLQAVNEM
jgi:hypothetical protein